MDNSKWIALEDQLPSPMEQVLACDITSHGRKEMQVVTYTGRPQREWQNTFDGLRTVGLHHFTHWMPLKLTMPIEKPENLLKTFLEDLSMKKRGETLTVEVGPDLTETVVDYHVRTKAQYENWGIKFDQSKRPILSYTFDY